MQNYLKSLNEHQYQAVLKTDGPLIVLAGAGSGKTKMLTSRIAYLIDACGVFPSQILAVTFTNKAAKEMQLRVDQILLESGVQVAGRPEIGTFHSVCVRLLRRCMPFTPFQQSFVIYDDSEQLSLIKIVMKKQGLSEDAVNPKAIQAAINRAKCDAIGPEDFGVKESRLSGRFLQTVKGIYTEYQKELFAQNALDFGEILCMSYRILRDHPQVLEQCQKQFRYIHVDEYQDTNRVQYLFLSLLASKKHGGFENICVVGDEDQSIYKWRGADIYNILDFEKEYPQAFTIKLEQNYRSTKNIILAASQLIQNNTQRKNKNLWSDSMSGDRIIHTELASERAEAEMVVSEIQRLSSEGKYSYQDMAVFYRTNAQSRQFEDVLRREKVPYQVVGGLRFYDRKEIKDILAYFRCILNPEDSVGLKRVIQVSGAGLGKGTIEKIENFSYLLSGKLERSVSSWEAIHAILEDSDDNFSPAILRKLKSFFDSIERFRKEQQQLSLIELYHFILDETKYVQELKLEATPEALARIENLEEFETILQEFEEEDHVDVKKSDLLQIFIERSTLNTDDLRSEAAAAIRLMTLHSSKGLEFPVVFMVGLEEGLFPSAQALDKDSRTQGETEEEEEERRLCYVGMTRAKRLLYMLHVTLRRLWGRESYQMPSRFLAEIPPELVEHRRFSYGSSVSSPFGNSFSAARSFSKKQMDSYSQVAELPWMGRQMTHPEYGFGTVVGSEGNGEEQKLLIQFRGDGRKKFLLKYVSNYFVDA